MRMRDISNDLAAVEAFKQQASTDLLGAVASLREKGMCIAPELVQSFAEATARRDRCADPASRRLVESLNRTTLENERSAIAQAQAMYSTHDGAIPFAALTEREQVRALAENRSGLSVLEAHRELLKRGHRVDASILKAKNTAAFNVELSAAIEAQK